MEFSLEELAQFSGAKILKTSQTNKKFAISTDTRTIGEGNIYLPLVGEKFDGHNFVEKALEAGAFGFFTSDEKIFFSDAKVIFCVPDTLEAYLKIAQAYKKMVAPKTIAITGSSGKTTTKEMIAAVCEKSFLTHKTKLNYNNEVGLAQTLLSMPENTQVLVLEMGMRGLGEIDFLAKFAEPEIGVVTNIGTAHVGRLGSVENIAKAKMELSKHVSELMITENSGLAFEYNKFAGKTLPIDLKKPELQILKMTGEASEFVYKNEKYKLNIEGEYNVLNALFAIEVGHELGMTSEKIAEGLLDYKPVGNRWKTEEICGFNANPESVKCALKTFLSFAEKPQVFVFGNMGELGDYEEFYHKEIGKFLDEFEPQTLLTVGELAKITAQNTKWKSVSFETVEDVAKYIKQNIPKTSTILLKASRSMEFEKIISEIEKL